MTYPQQPQQQHPQQPGYGVPQQYPADPPGPPPKKNTGLVVGIIAAVVLVVGGVLVTGFVAPGFFLSDEKKDDDKAAPPKAKDEPDALPGNDTRGGESLDVPGGSGGADIKAVEEVAQQGTESINKRDTELAKSVSCDPAGASSLSDPPPGARAEVTGEPAQVGSEAFKVPVKFSAKGNSNQGFLDVAKKDGRWCIT